MAEERNEYIDVAVKFLTRALLGDLFLVVPEVLILTFLGLWDAILGLALGTVAFSVGIIAIAKSYENYSTVKLGKLAIPRMYFLRYAFYASIFLLSTLLSREKVLGIVGTFVGMVNFKIVFFLFAWRWDSWGKRRG